MKLQTTLLAIAVVAFAMTAHGQQASGWVAATLSRPNLTMEQQKFEWLTPWTSLVSPRTLVPNEILRYEGLSSRPWTNIVGWYPGILPSVAKDSHEAQLCLISLKF